jgi:hypothetical protein
MEREEEGERVHFAWKQAVQNSLSKGYESNKNHQN